MQGASERAQVARIKSVVPSLAITFYSGSLSGDPPDLRRFIAPDCNFGSAKIGVAASETMRLANLAQIGEIKFCGRSPASAQIVGFRAWMDVPRLEL